METDRRDDWLTHFIDLMYRTQVYFPLTLTLPGLVVSGEVIPSQEFFRLSGESIDEAWRRATNSQESPWTPFFARWAERAVNARQETVERVDAFLAGTPEEEGIRPEDPRHQEIRELLPHYIHLKDVVIYAGHAQPIRSTCWRGKLEDVSGFTIGKIEPPIPASPHAA